MKKRLSILLSLLLLMAWTGNAQTAKYILTPKGIGDIKVGAKMRTIPSEMPPLYTSVSNFGDEWAFTTDCKNDKDETIISVVSGEDDNLEYQDLPIKTIVVFSPGVNTSEGFSVGSTCEQLLKAGGKKKSSVIYDEKSNYVELGGLYYYFDRAGGFGQEIAPEDKVVLITNNYRYFEF